MAWKRACLLINILEESDIQDDEVWDITQQIHDVASGIRQTVIQTSGSIPTFQYTNTPIVPPDIGVQGMTGKVGLQVRVWPYRDWCLKHGQWQCVEFATATLWFTIHQ